MGGGAEAARGGGAAWSGGQAGAGAGGGPGSGGGFAGARPGRGFAGGGGRGRGESVSVGGAPGWGTKERLHPEQRMRRPAAGAWRSLKGLAQFGQVTRVSSMWRPFLLAGGRGWGRDQPTYFNGFRTAHARKMRILA